MGYTCTEHPDIPAVLLVTNLDNGDTVALCGPCVHPWSAAIAAVTDPEATADAQPPDEPGPDLHPVPPSGTDGLDEPVAEPVSTDDWTHPLDRAEAEAEKRGELGEPDDQAEPTVWVTSALDGPEWPANQPAGP